MIKQCVVCGAEFDGRGCSKSCSKQCAYIRMRETKKLEKAKYFAKYPDRVKAQKAAYRARQRAKAAPQREIKEIERRAKLANLIASRTRECVVCGAEFYAKTRVKTCSEECWKTRHRQTRLRPEKNLSRDDSLKKKMEAQKRLNDKRKAAMKFVRKLFEDNNAESPI